MDGRISGKRKNKMISKITNPTPSPKSFHSTTIAAANATNHSFEKFPPIKKPPKIIPSRKIMAMNAPTFCASTLVLLTIPLKNSATLPISNTNYSFPTQEIFKPAAWLRHSQHVLITASKTPNPCKMSPNPSSFLTHFLPTQCYVGYSFHSRA